MMTRSTEKKSLKEWREERHLTQLQLAAKAGVSISAITDYETGRRTPNMGTAEKIVEALGITFDNVNWRIKKEE